MRIFAYIRVNPDETIDPHKYISIFGGSGYHIQKSRLIVEEVLVEKSISYRDKFSNLVNYALEEGDSLIVKGIDCLGNSFEEILNIINKIEQKKVRLVCMDYSKNEINGDLKTVFIHFLKLCTDFEKKLGVHHNFCEINRSVKRVGRPEKLTEAQKNQVIENFKKGKSIYCLAKDFSVTRTVIRRVLDKNKCNI
ncbi:recombinase family protein [Acinetobacter baumannii]|uniref:recombinase family protein n=1 Tax=Acinetobacter pittii TaxID=48296 RepID=UPI001950E4A3|nr:recombinase family protein [Acinetobacter pittii]MDO7494887.1 recombinase family protein [Acinetobacter baumannii]QRQ11536.1 recombinase family protein [Acinetobacter pittii]